jgi:hypothetical protein
MKTRILIALMLLFATVSFAVPKTLTKMPNPLPKERLKEALKTPFDLMARMDVVYHLKAQKPDRFKEGESYEVTNYNIQGLIVEDRKNTETNTTLQGSRTNNEGYLLINYDYANDAGLVTPDGNFKGNPNRDTFTYQNRVYEIIDIVPVGQLVDEFTAFKIYYKYKK